jgi:uncharacterized protein (DUF3820 family)
MVTLEQMRRRYFLQGLVQKGQQLEVLWKEKGKSLICPACEREVMHHPGTEKAHCDTCGLEIPLIDLKWPEGFDPAEEPVEKPVASSVATDGAPMPRPPLHFNCRSAVTGAGDLSLEMTIDERDAGLVMAEELETQLKTQVIKELQFKTGLTPAQILEGTIRITRLDGRTSSGDVEFDVTFAHSSIRRGSTLGDRLAKKKNKKGKSKDSRNTGPFDHLGAKHRPPPADPNAYDVSKCRYEMIDNATDAELQFGKNKGKKISDLTGDPDGISYLDWMMKQDFPPGLKAAIGIQLKKKRAR